MRQEKSWLRLWVSGLVAMLLLACSSVASAFAVPEHRGAVTDTAGVLTAADDDYLERRIAQYRAKTGNELGVLVVRSLEGETIEDVAYQTFNRWGVGTKGLDNGVLLVIAIAEHRTRIETGKGIGDKLTDLAAGRILSERLAPKLRAGAFRDGIDVTLAAIENEIDGVPTTAPSPAPTTNAKSAGARASSSFAGLAFLLVGSTALALALLFARSNGQSFRRAGGSSRRFGRGRRSWGHADVHSTWVHHDVPTVTTSFTSVDTSSSFTGGGDFGGGSSGGGGASGSW